MGKSLLPSSLKRFVDNLVTSLLFEKQLSCLFGTEIYHNERKHFLYYCITPLSPNHHHLMYCRIQRLRWQERVMGMLLEPGKAVHRLIAHYLWLALPQYYFHCWFSCFSSIPTKVWCFKLSKWKNNPYFPPKKLFQWK